MIHYPDHRVDASFDATLLPERSNSAESVTFKTRIENAFVFAVVAIVQLFVFVREVRRDGAHRLLGFVFRVPSVDLKPVWRLENAASVIGSCVGPVHHGSQEGWAADSTPGSSGCAHGKIDHVLAVEGDIAPHLVDSAGEPTAMLDLVRLGVPPHYVEEASRLAPNDHDKRRLPSRQQMYAGRLGL